MIAQTPLEPGDRIRFLGQAWQVEGVFWHQGRLLFALFGADGCRSCIAADGADGPWELLAAARDSDQSSARLPAPNPQLSQWKGAELAETLASSPAADPITTAGEQRILAGTAAGSRDVPLSRPASSPVVAVASPVPDHRFAPRPWRP